MSHPLVFLVDIDNTLLDHDELKRRFGEFVEEVAGKGSDTRSWETYESVRLETRLADLPETARRFGSGVRPEVAQQVARRVWDFPFDELVFPGTHAALERLAAFGLPVIVCEGNREYQRHKLRVTGLSPYFEERVLVFDHKEEHIDTITRLFPAEHYVMLDDKPRIHRAMRSALRQRVTTVLIQQGHYSQEPGEWADINASTVADFVMQGVVLPAGVRQRARTIERLGNEGDPVSIKDG